MYVMGIFLIDTLATDREMHGPQSFYNFSVAAPDRGMGLSCQFVTELGLSSMPRCRTVRK